jgi:hypothetical protein
VTVQIITLAELHARMNAQQAPDRRFIATKCPVCGTVQNMQSLIDAGASDREAENAAGYSCVGRFTGAGPWKRDEPPGRGCDWTLGGLFKLHKLEVEVEGGRRESFFEIATPQEAQELWRRQMSAILQRGEGGA